MNEVMCDFQQRLYYVTLKSAHMCHYHFFMADTFKGRSFSCLKSTGDYCTLLCCGPPAFCSRESALLQFLKPQRMCPPQR